MMGYSGGFGAFLTHMTGFAPKAAFLAPATLSRCPEGALR
jgi:hypothetical protein